MIGFLCAWLGVCAPQPAPAPQVPPSIEQPAPEPQAMPSGEQPAPAAQQPQSATPVVMPEVPAQPAALPEAQPATASQQATPSPPVIPAWQRFAVAAAPADGRPTISFVIDDVGVNQAQSARAIALPAPVTLSFLPYAPRLSAQIAAATARGHEIMLHMPMEAFGRMDPGPGTLRTWLPPQTNLANLRQALDAVPNAVALNQHEGSVASLSVPLMDMVMGELKGRGMAFLDSLTIPHSVAFSRAQAAGIPSVARDVFLDNDNIPSAIRARLAEVESVARRFGHAIAIGHPRQATMDVMTQYFQQSAGREFVLWPVSATVAAENRVQLTERRK